MAYQLRERDLATLEEMQKGSLVVEVSLMEKREIMKMRRECPLEKKVQWKAWRSFILWGVKPLNHFLTSPPKI